MGGQSYWRVPCPTIIYVSATTSPIPLGTTGTPASPRLRWRLGSAKAKLFATQSPSSKNASKYKVGEIAPNRSSVTPWVPSLEQRSGAETPSGPLSEGACTKTNKLREGFHSFAAWCEELKVPPLPVLPTCGWPSVPPVAKNPWKASHPPNACPSYCRLKHPPVAHQGNQQVSGGFECGPSHWFG